jgi:hypothetical protein
MMRLRQKCFLALTAILFLSVAKADDNWTTLGTTAGGDLTELNVPSLKVDGKSVTFWVRSKYKTPKPWTDGGVSKKITYGMTRYRVACAEETLTMLAWTEYDAQGNVVVSNVIDFPKPRPIVPESVGQNFHESVCFLTVNKQDLHSPPRSGHFFSLLLNMVFDK